MFQKPTYEELFEENQILKAIIKTLSETLDRQEARMAELKAILNKTARPAPGRKATGVKGPRKAIKEVPFSFPMSRIKS
ncbi:MAG: hypothetical protein PHU72_06695 [Dethiosulfovibrio sp.]|nr:hypothetical protein [Dethiosulfovibrio sp.]